MKTFEKGNNYIFLFENGKKINIRKSEFMDFIAKHSQANKSKRNNAPYIIKVKVITEKHYNPNYGDNKKCKCGHSYEKHFDSYENMSPLGCKYCDCNNFKEEK